MRVLYVGDSFNGDDSQGLLSSFSRLPALRNAHISTSFRKRDNASEIALLCKQKQIDAVLCSQPALLQAALTRLPDYIAPSHRRQITINDYAGSWIDLPYGIPLVVINHLDRLPTIAYEKFVTNRHISKITQPELWYPQTEFKWKQVHDYNAESILNDLESCDLLAIDIETPGDVNRSISCVGYCAYWYSSGRSECYVVHFESEWAWRFVQRANRTRAQKIFQNGQYDCSYFARWNCLPSNYLWDTLNLMHSWYSELPKRLDFIAAFALRKMRYWKDDGRTGNLEDLFRYNALDAWATLNSFLSLIREIPEWAMENYLQEFPMIFPAFNAAMEGFKIDRVMYKKVIDQKEAEAAKSLERIRYLISEPKFNPRSPEQTKNLFKVLGVGSLPNTDKASMLKARAASPLNDLILGEVVEYRGAAKLISSYLDEDKLWNDRWYYAIDPAGTDTGRCASKASAYWCGDSIQTMPRGDTLKQCFLPDTGWLLAEPDKAQSEARCVGYLAGEQSLIDLVEGPHDYHAWNASAFFGIPYEAIYDEQLKRTLDKVIRDLSKRTNHGANYNMGAAILLATMGPKMVAKAKRVLKLPAKMSLLAVCQHLLDAYDRKYPNVRGLNYEHVISTIALTNRLVSPLGWTRYFFGKPSRQNKPALNAAVAHGPQNLSVSIINREWYALWRSSIYGDLRGKVRVKAQIHDSIPFQYRPEDSERTLQRVTEIMHTAVQVTGADKKTRTLVIPTDMKAKGERWSTLE